MVCGARFGHEKIKCGFYHVNKAVAQRNTACLKSTLKEKYSLLLGHATIQPWSDRGVLTQHQ
jgi:hypothetical protein